MKFILTFVFTLVLGVMALAEDGPTPSTCMFNGQNDRGSRAVRKELQCNDFDLKYPKNYSNVCVFKDHVWQFGKFTYDAKKKSHKFTTTRVCDVGIYVTPKEQAMELASPNMSDFYEKRTDRVELIKGKYVSKVVPALTDKEAPVMCYLRDNSGTPYAPLACTQQPNEVGFCEAVDMPKSSKNTGYWWVRYSGPKKTGRTLCYGGVKISKLDEAESVFGEDQTKARVSVLPKANLIAKLPKPALDADNAIPLQLATCIFTEKQKETKVICANQASATFESWIDNQDEYEALIKAQVEAKKENLATLKKVRTNEANIRKYANSASYAAKVATWREDNNNLLAGIDTQIEELVSAQGSKSGKYPVNKTVPTTGNCHIEWNPDSGATVGAFAFRSKGKVMERISCEKIEIVEKVEIGQ